MGTRQKLKLIEVNQFGAGLMLRMENHSFQGSMWSEVINSKGSSRIVIIFTRVCWGEWPLYTFLNVYYDALHFHMGSSKINIFKVLFWEGVVKKSSVCTLLIMLDDPNY